ncbi:hypothetical protein RSK20926_13344 [Roseobacter sp. SK209-2-6]|uniref:methyltransferase domain-containing protein n=1 Tax=Roseobacter sp. SK209-2-6 TaxID=388739 RepID=UPI0000F3C497|nr:hypothetical protein [Roseobacter sp. SK209-2-6]EBA18710.1 hypothetical protein RSK20926_13344 [Roseobacter sp. SK209-2-6]
MQHVYSNAFYDYIDQGARSSAQTLISLLQPQLHCQSVLDLGSGRGVWLSEWQRAGVQDTAAADGDYVDRNRLAINPQDFHAADLTQPFDLKRCFDLAQSLEVGEHLPESASATLVASLTRHSNRVLFSAAVSGQGGEYHINEKPLSFWQELFEAQGYSAFDCLRPSLKNRTEVEPWYRYNTILYVNKEGREGLPPSILKTEIPMGSPVPLAGSLGWRLRRGVVSLMPRAMVTGIAKGRAAVIARQAQKAQA